MKNPEECTQSNVNSFIKTHLIADARAIEDLLHFKIAQQKSETKDLRLRLRLCKCLGQDRDKSLVLSRSEKWSRLRDSLTPGQ